MRCFKLEFVLYHLPVDEYLAAPEPTSGVALFQRGVRSPAKYRTRP